MEDSEREEIDIDEVPEHAHSARPSIFEPFCQLQLTEQESVDEEMVKDQVLDAMEISDSNPVSRTPKKMNGTCILGGPIDAGNPWIENDSPQPSSKMPAEVSYTLISNASRSGKVKLIDSYGYVYKSEVKQENSDDIVWTCIVKNNTIECGATVYQNGLRFMKGKEAHFHPVSLDAAIVMKMESLLKDELNMNTFTFPSEVSEWEETKPAIANTLMPSYDINSDVVKNERLKCTNGNDAGMASGWSSPQQGLDFCMTEDQLMKNSSLPQVKEEPGDITYTVVSKGSLRGRPMLIDSSGYTYTLKNEFKNGNRMWRCSARNKPIYCHVLLHQAGQSFKKGRHSHLHPGNHGDALLKKLRSNIKCLVKKDIFTSLSDIVNNVLPWENESNIHMEAAISPENLKNTANKVCQQMLPREPIDLDFDIDPDLLSDTFLRGDIRVENRRHLILASDKMVELLSKSDVWYIDIAPDLIKEPFTQVLSIQSFGETDGKVKHLPLTYVLMSDNRMEDYRKVLTTIKGMCRGIALKKVVTGFERSLWSAVPFVFENVTIKGCVLQWKLCLLAKIQELGLPEVYAECCKTRRLLSNFLSLVFLPYRNIPAVFKHLTQKTTLEELTEFVDYFRDTWMCESLWPPETWSVFNKPIRLIGDVDLWQHAFLNVDDQKVMLSFYQATHILQECSKLVDSEFYLISEDQLKHIQKKNLDQFQGQLFSVWDRCLKRGKTVSELLRKCRHLVEKDIENLE